MSEKKTTTDSPPKKQDALWANIGDGRWYAIPSTMADQFRSAGAEVRPANELPPQ